MKLYELAEEYNELSAMLDQEDMDPIAIADPQNPRHMWPARGG